MAQLPAIVETQRIAYIEDAMSMAPFALSEWVARLRLKGTADDWRKFNEFVLKLAEPEKRENPNANLPVFHFTFQNGGMQATITAAPAPELVQEVQPLDSPAPLPALTKTDEENVAEMMAGVDELLKDL